MPDMNRPAPSPVRAGSNMQRIIVTNAKGGCGKSTIATNLASQLANKGVTALYDYDPQGSATQWLKLREPKLPQIHGVIAHRRTTTAVTRSFQLRIPPETRYAIYDTPAGIYGVDLMQMVQQADFILIPVLPSPIDIHAATQFVRDLLLVGKARNFNVRIGVIANRVRKNTVMYKALRQFLNSLEITFVTSLRDTQNYAKAALNGIGVQELKIATASRDAEQWCSVIKWLSEAEPSHEAPVAAQPARFAARAQVSALDVSNR